MADNRKRTTKRRERRQQHGKTPKSNEGNMRGAELRRIRRFRWVGAGVGVAIGAILASIMVAGHAPSISMSLLIYGVYVGLFAMFCAVLGDWSAYRKTTVRITRKWSERRGRGKHSRNYYFVDTDKGTETEVGPFQFRQFKEGETYRVYAQPRRNGGISIRSWFTSFMTLFWCGLLVAAAIYVSTAN